jgi:Flp pilus assembly protein TadG
MMKPARPLQRLRSDENGAMLVETALVTPMLVLMSLGAFQISGIVARQAELESAASEASAIALASKPDTSVERTTLANVISASTGLPVANTGGTASTKSVAVTEAFRCGTDTAYITNEADCVTGHMSSFVKITLTDVYTPAWAEFGVGSDINYNVTRYVMYQQDERD